MLWMKPIVLDGIFSKWVIQDRWEYTMDIPYSPDARNIRLVNGNTVMRNGYVARAIDDTNIGKIPQGMTSLDNIYVARNSKLQKINLTTGLYEDVAGATFSGDYPVEFVTFGKFVICLTGVWYPYILNTTSGTRTQLTSTNIEAVGNPKFWATFAYGSYVSGWAEGNILYMSRWATKANPEYVYDRVGTWSEQLYMKWRILGMVATLNRLFIRTEKGIEYLSKDTIATVWGVTTTLSVPLSWENQPASQRSIVVADDLVFFLTKTLQVKSLNYTPWVTEAQVGNISERPSQSIRSFFDMLEVDQSASYGYYNKTQRTVTWYLKKKGSTFNDVCLVYDIINDCFLIDSNRFGWCGTFFNGSYYVGSNLNSYTYEADIGYDDDWALINWYRYTKRINFSSPNKRKVFREVGTVWQNTPRGEIWVDVIVDGKLQYSTIIDWWDMGSISWYWSSPTGSTPIGWEFPTESSLRFFNKLITRGQLRSKWVWIQLKYYGSTDFVLSSVSMWVKALDSTDLWDKI